MKSRFDQPADDSERDLRINAIRRSCVTCNGDVYCAKDEPYVMHPVCDRCLERALSTLEPLDPRD